MENITVRSSGTRKLYVENDHRMARIWLTDEEYAKASPCFILVSTDIILINEQMQSIYLAERCVAPCADRWLLGGRRQAGETAQESVLRCFKRETFLDLEPRRFTYAMQIECIWKDRKQEPVSTGCHFLTDVYALAISASDAKIISRQLHSEEYIIGSLREFSYDDLVREKVHQSVIDVYDSIFPLVHLTI